MYSETRLPKINTWQARWYANIFYSETSQIACGLPVGALHFGRSGVSISSPPIQFLASYLLTSIHLLRNLQKALAQVRIFMSRTSFDANFLRSFDPQSGMSSILLLHIRNSMRKLKRASNGLEIVWSVIGLPLLCEAGTVGKISDYQPEGPGFNHRPGRGLNFGRTSFAAPFVDVRALV